MSDHELTAEKTNKTTLLIVKIISIAGVLGVSLLFGFFPLFW